MRILACRCKHFRRATLKPLCVAVCANPQPAHITFDDRQLLLFLTFFLLWNYTIIQTNKQNKTKPACKETHLRPSNCLSSTITAFVPISPTVKSFLLERAWEVLAVLETNLKSSISSTEFFLPGIYLVPTYIALVYMFANISHWQGKCPLDCSYMCFQL